MTWALDMYSDFLKHDAEFRRIFSRMRFSPELHDIFVVISGHFSESGAM